MAHFICYNRQLCGLQKSRLKSSTPHGMGEKRKNGAQQNENRQKIVKNKEIMRFPLWINFLTKSCFLLTA
jgi:hypothetical protein